jgi:hypothetical protein
MRSKMWQSLGWYLMVMTLLGVGFISYEQNKTVVQQQALIRSMMTNRACMIDQQALEKYQRDHRRQVLRITEN